MIRPSHIWYANLGNGGTVDGVGKITTGGVATDCPIGFAANGVAAGSDGNIWFTVRGTAEVGFVTTSCGGPTTFTNGISGSPNQIVAGPDGNEYFDEIAPTGQTAVAKITPTGTVTEYALPYGFSPTALTVGPDNNVWVLDANHDQLGQLVLPKKKPTSCAACPNERTGR
jgi:virginiamycin B lyase